VYSGESETRVAAIRGRLPHLEVLIQVADNSGNTLLPGAVDFESIVTTTPGGMPTPSGDDLYVLYTGRTRIGHHQLRWLRNAGAP
jgi:hypothetical protein